MISNARNFLFLDFEKNNNKKKDFIKLLCTKKV